MINDPILIIAVTGGVAALIGGILTYFETTRLLKILFFLWAVPSIVLMVPALMSVPFDREIYVLLWTTFALPSPASVWLVRTMKG